MCQIATVRVWIGQSKLIHIFFTVEGKGETEDVVVLMLRRFVVKYLEESFVEYLSILVSSFSVDGNSLGLWESFATLVYCCSSPKASFRFETDLRSSIC